MARQTVIHWFRKGLRLHDNPALLHAIDLAVKNQFFLRPIFILDSAILKWLLVGPNRWRFLQQSLADLDGNLKKIGSQLYVVRGDPKVEFKRLFSEWNVHTLTYEFDIEPYAISRDECVKKLAKEHQVIVVESVSHTIYTPEIVVKKNGGKPPMTYQRFLSVIESLPKPDNAKVSPEKVPSSTTPIPDKLEVENKNCYDVPSLQELGVDESSLTECLFLGGETEALSRLQNVIKRKSWICKFEKPNTSPNSLEPSTTVLSPYLKFGCLSSKLFYHELKKVLATSPHTKPPVSLIGQLMWREFYYVVAAVTPNFDRMIGNPICCQIPWETNDEHLQAWTHGKTGYPFIDAIMRQLRLEGWIHHLARHAVACFLTRGDLWISWEEGQKVFEELLLDADWALNAGNWMWLSASAFFHQFFRVYSPVAFGKKTDKFGDYIKKYVPELKKFPPEYIYEPWNAPLAVQNRCGCVIGKDYPKRVVVHEHVHKVNISKMSLAYKNKKDGENVASTSKKKAPSKTKSPPAKKSKTQTSIGNFFK